MCVWGGGAGAESELRSDCLEESGAALHLTLHLMESQTIILLTTTQYAQAQKVRGKGREKALHF